ncbi:MAG: amidohydrolase [Planctomycetes bacterium]|nr:amidohydrolase [Planctomycetota bacterium]
MKIAALVCAAVLSACIAPPRAPLPDTLIFNGTIYLGEPRWTRVDALLVADGRVVAAGTLAELAPDLAHVSRRIDLRGGFAVPGLQDAHGHLQGFGEALEIVDLRGAASFEEVVARVVERARSAPRGAWVRGRGWDQNLWPSRDFPTHAALSAALPEHPVVLERVDGHACVANLAAMQLAGVARAFSSEFEIPGGRVLLDAERRPSGVFVDAATAVFDAALPPLDEATRERRVLAAQDALLALGLTAVHDMGISAGSAELLRRLRDTGRLRIRLIEYLQGSAQLADDDVAGFPWPPDSLDRLSVVGVKFYADGALGSRGAVLLEPYSDDPSQLGLALMSREELEHGFAVCARHGLQPAVHAIGDGANRTVLDALEARIRATPEFAALRPRIEHAQVVAPDDWARFEELGVIASMQPTHATSDMPWAPRRLGPERISGAYAWRRLASRAEHLALGSDFPVESPNPLEGLYAAITCSARDGQPPQGFLPDQRLSAREALAGFTWGAARAARQEQRRGALWPGYAADLTVLDVDPLACAPAALLTARVLSTIIDGELVYSAP